MFSFLSGFFILRSIHVVRIDSSSLLVVSRFHCVGIPVCLSIHLVMDLWVVASLGLLDVKLL